MGLKMPKKRKKKSSVIYPLLTLLAVVLIHLAYFIKIQDPLTTIVSLLQLSLIVWGIAYTTHLIKGARVFAGVLFFLIFILLLIYWMFSFFITIGI